MTHAKQTRRSKTYFLSILLVLAALMGNVATAYGYTSLYPKVSTQPTQVIVLDMRLDIGNNPSWVATEVLLANTVIQGIVNRSGSTKIYFVNTPKESFWNTYSTDQNMLSDGIVPSNVTRIYPTLNTSKTYPVLSYLLSTYSSLIQGKILYPSMSSSIVPGTVSAAITGAGYANSIAASPAVNTYLTNEGYSFPVTGDTRSITNNVDANNYALSNFKNASTASQYVGIYCTDAFGGNLTPGRQVPVMTDYFVATRAFVTCLDGNVTNQVPAIDSLIVNHYHPGVPILGMPHDEGASLNAIEDSGGYLVIASNANLSVLSSFPSNPSELTAYHAPTPSSIDPNGAYVTFYQTDGDNLSSINHHYHFWRNSSTTGQVAMGWSVNPAMFDLMPTMLKWRSANAYNGIYENVIKFNDGAEPHTSAGKTKYINDINNYINNSNNLYSTLNYLDSNPGNIVPGVDIDFIIQGYQGATNGNAVSWGTMLNSNAVKTNLSGCTQSCATATEVYNAARHVANATPAGTPSFVIVPVGAGWEDGTAAAKGARDLLLANPNGRTYYFLPPQDLMATWRAWQNGMGTTTYQAENASLSGGASVASDHSGYTGTGFAQGYWDTGATTSFTVQASASGTRNVTLRYASGDSASGNRTIAVFVNGVKAMNASLPKTADWSTWTTMAVSLNLNAGSNTIDIKQESGSYGNAINLDSITVDQPSSQLLEAESASLSGGASIANDHAGYTDTGFVQGYWSTGAAATFTVQASSAGARSLIMRYASGDSASGNRTIAIYVNGVKVMDSSLPKTANWDVWTTKTESVSLNAGSNTIMIKQESGSYGNAINLDSITLQ